MEKDICCSCKDGWAADHPIVRHIHRYTFWGWIAICTGITAKPKKIDYQCPCGNIFHSTTNPEILKKYIS